MVTEHVVARKYRRRVGHGGARWWLPLAVLAAHCRAYELAILETRIEPRVLQLLAQIESADVILEVLDALVACIDSLPMRPLQDEHCHVARAAFDAAQ